MRSRLLFIALGIGFGLAFDATVALAWTGPTASAPNANINAPVNVGTTAQVKNGDFAANNVSAFGNMLLSGLGIVGGAGRYINFDYSQAGNLGTGSSGYGIRDNAGTLEFKNVGGTWSSLQALVGGGGGGQWVTGTGGAIYYNGGNVGIGTATPTFTAGSGGLHIGGGTTGQAALRMDNSNGQTSQFNRWANRLALSTSDSFSVEDSTFSPNLWVNTATDRVGINTATPVQALDINGYGRAAGGFFFDDNNPGNGVGQGFYLQNFDGAFYISNSNNYVWSSNRFWVDSGGTAFATAYIYNSDARLKNVIGPIKDALGKVLAITGVNFTWKAGLKAGQKDIGVIAQDVQKVAPEVVHEDKDGILSVDYPRLVPILIQAIKEQQTEIDTLKARLDKLESK